MKSFLEKREASNGVIEHHHGRQGSYLTYTIGFVASVILTLFAFFFAARGGSGIVTIVVGLAVIQLVVQLIFFLHLSAHPKERWNLTAFIFTTLMLWFIVVGSLWILNHLNRNMTDAQIEAYMHSQN